MVNLVISSFGYLVICASTLRTEVSACGADGSREDRAELDCFLQEIWNFRGVNDAHSPDNLKPERAFVGFFDYDTESSDELRTGASVTGSAIVGADRWRTFRQLISDDFGTRSVGKLVD